MSCATCPCRCTARHKTLSHACGHVNYVDLGDVSACLAHGLQQLLHKAGKHVHFANMPNVSALMSSRFLRRTGSQKWSICLCSAPTQVYIYIYKCSEDAFHSKKRLSKCTLLFEPSVAAHLMSWKHLPRIWHVHIKSVTWLLSCVWTVYPCLYL